MLNCGADRLWTSGGALSVDRAFGCERGMSLVRPSRRARRALLRMA